MSWVEVVDGEPIIVYALDVLYGVLMSMVSNEMVDEMDNPIFTKADTTRFERIPAIGFGIPTIESVDELSQNNKINIDIPMVIQDAGSKPNVTLSLVKLYEQYKEMLNSNIDSYIDATDLSVDVCELDRFTPQEDPNDQSMAGLGVLFLKFHPLHM